eukprot:3476938-Ditylum_brightwellii.AAC.1
MPALEATAKYYGRKVFKPFTMVTCSNNDPTSTIHQPGGVCIGVMGKAIGRILETSKDPTRLGIWVSILFAGNNSKKHRVV